MHSLLFLLFLSLHLLSPTLADLANDTAALLSFRFAVGRAILPWNASLSSCQWKGITCSSNNRVITIRLPATGLAGQIPSGTIGNLTELRVISLRHNALSGPLPFDLARCTRLRVIHLERNRFSGKFPLFLSSLPNLARLNLAENNFVGEIPSSINNLKRLTVLYLENNGFVGEMPDLDIPNLVRFNVSFNHLNGSVPEKFRGMPVESFLGMSMCGGPLKPCVRDTSSSPSSKNPSNLSGGAIAGIAIGAIGLLVLILLTMFLLFWCKTKRGESRSTEIHPIQESNVDHGTTAPVSPGVVVSKKQLVFLPGVPRVFDLETLLRASAEVLGKGKTCITYKAEMEVDLAVTTVVVKRFKDLKMEKKEFAKKIETIGAAKHANLVPLLAYYYSKEEKLLVYDYIQEPNLSSILHGVGKSHLNWENRVKIALDVAQGIEHIHSISPYSAHGNIKSSNILLTGSFGSRLADHGVAQFARSVSREGDIFGFGVVLIELVTGKAPDPGRIAGGGVGVRRWAELFDEELVRLGSPEEEMIMLMEIGVECSSKLPGNRPAMAAVVARIEGIRRNGAQRKVIVG